MEVVVIDPAVGVAIHDDDQEHVLIKIPEMVSNILSYLPKADLLSCTQVNRTWEVEARKYLLNQATVRLNPENLLKYMDVINVRGNCHSSIHLRLQSFRNKVKDSERCIHYYLTEFAKTNAGKVRHLSTDWRLDTEIGRPYFAVWNLFTSLISLELRPFISQFGGYRVINKSRNAEARASSMRELDNLIPPNIVFSVKNVSFKVHPLDEEVKIILKADGFASRILKMFPHVTALKFWNYWEPFLRTDFDFQQITSLSILTQENKHSPHHNLQSVLDLPLLKNLTHLEFNLKVHINPNGGVGDAASHNKAESRDWGRILTKFSPTLERITIRHVRNTFRAIEPSTTLELILPVMPRLKMIKIHRSPFDEKWLSPWANLNVDQWLFLESAYPSIELKFASGEENQDLPIDYPQQFPSLAHLAIVKEKERRVLWNTTNGEKQVPLDDEGFFETCVPLLYSSFLMANNSTPCITLTTFDIIWPEEYEGDETLQLLSGPACPCFDNYGNSKCVCWRWIKLSKFYERIIQTFPKVENPATRLRLEIYKERQIEENVMKFVQLGKALGYVEQGGWIYGNLPSV